MQKDQLKKLMAEAGFKKFEFTCQGIKCCVITMDNYSLTLNMPICMTNYRAQVDVEVNIIPDTVNRVSLNNNDTLTWFDCDTVEQANGLKEFISEYNDNWRPDPDL